MDSVSNTYGSFKPDEGNTYYVITCSVANNRKTADTFLPTYSMGDDVSALILYQDAYEFRATNLLGYSKELHDQKLNPLSSTEGNISFELPENVASAEDGLIMQLKAGDKYLRVKFR